MRARWSATGPQDPVQLQNKKINKKRITYYIIIIVCTDVCIDVSALYVTDKGGKGALLVRKGKRREI